MLSGYWQAIPPSVADQQFNVNCCPKLLTSNNVHRLHADHFHLSQGTADDCCYNDLTSDQQNSKSNKYSFELCWPLTRNILHWIHWRWELLSSNRVCRWPATALIEFISLENCWAAIGFVADQPPPSLNSFHLRISGLSLTSNRPHWIHFSWKMLSSNRVCRWPATALIEFISVENCWAAIGLSLTSNSPHWICWSWELLTSNWVVSGQKHPRWFFQFENCWPATISFIMDRFKTSEAPCIWAHTGLGTTCACKGMVMLQLWVMAVLSFSCIVIVETPFDLSN